MLFLVGIEVNVRRVGFGSGYWTKPADLFQIVSMKVVFLIHQQICFSSGNLEMMLSWPNGLLELPASDFDKTYHSYTKAKAFEIYTGFITNLHFKSHNKWHLLYLAITAQLRDWSWMDGWWPWFGPNGRNGPDDSSGPNGPPKWSKWSIGHASIMGWSKMEDHDHGYIGPEMLLVKVKYIFTTIASLSSNL